MLVQLRLARNRVGSLDSVTFRSPPEAALQPLQAPLEYLALLTAEFQALLIAARDLLAIALGGPGSQTREAWR